MSMDLRYSLPVTRYSTETPNSETFTMNGGKISGNTAFYGGGVHVNSGIFIMNGGEISGNTASSYGGGVYINGNNVSLFKKTGGTIYGNITGDNKSNVVRNSSSVVQYNCGSTVYVDNSNNSYIKRKENTSGPGDNLSYIEQTVWTGAWNY